MGNVCQYRPMLEATFLKFVNGPQQEEKRRSQAHRSSQQDRQGHHGQTGVLEEAGSSGQKRKAGEADEDEADRGREPDHAEEPQAKQSRVGDIASRRAELL